MLRPERFYQIHPSKKSEHRDGQVDRQILIALETLEGFLDGHAADVHSERRAKTKPVSLAQEMLIERQEVLKLWIRTHKRLESDGMLHK